MITDFVRYYFLFSLMTICFKMMTILVEPAFKDYIYLFGFQLTKFEEFLLLC